MHACPTWDWRPIWRSHRSTIFWTPTLPHCAFSREPACYYANHQTSYESFLLSFVHFALTGAPLFVVTHPGLFDNDYGEHCTLLAELLHRIGHRAADRIQVVAVPHELRRARDFLLALPDCLDGRSLLVHVGAWREVYEGQPVNTMSRDLMEVTMRLGRSVVPIRISGACRRTRSATSSICPTAWGVSPSKWRRRYRTTRCARRRQALGASGFWMRSTPWRRRWAFMRDGRTIR